MKKFLNNLKNETAHIRMSEAEKSAMRAAIFGAPTVAPRQSPYVFLSFFSQHEMRMVMAGVMLLVLVGGGTVSAAQGALPGDILYPVKLSINERVEMVLANDEEAKAAVELSLAERRVEEAQTLASQGRLNAEAAAELAANFDTHAANAQALADGAEVKEPGTAEQVRVKLASSLNARGAVLKELGNSSTDEGTKNESTVLGDKVIARAEGPVVAMLQARSAASFAPMMAPDSSDAAGGGSASGTEIATLSVVAADAPAPVAASDATMQKSANTVAADPAAERAAARLQKKAAEALADAKEVMEKVASKLDATTTARVQEQFSAADEEMAQGSALLGAKAYADAKARFTTALRLATKLEAFLKAEQRFDNGVLRNLLNAESGVRIELEVGR